MKFFPPRRKPKPRTVIRCACGHDSPLEFTLTIGGTIRHYRWRLNPRGNTVPIACADCLNRNFQQVEVIDDKVEPVPKQRHLRTANA